MKHPEISNYIVEQFKKAQSDKVLGGNRSHTVHVSHLTGHCMRKTWYDFHLPEKPLSYSSVCNFFLGTILHENVSLGGRNEVPLSANIRTKQTIEIKDIGNHNYYDCLTGTVDDILEIDGDTVIVDKKTTNQIPEFPAEESVTQINFYKLLLYIQEGIEAKIGAILYLDKPSSFKETNCFVFHLWSLQDIEKQIISKLDQLKCKDEPDRVVTSRCDWCPHLHACDPYGNGGYRKS